MVDGLGSFPKKINKYFLFTIHFKVTLKIEIIIRNMIPWSLPDKYIYLIKSCANFKSYFKQIFLTDSENYVSKKTRLKFYQPITIR